MALAPPSPAPDREPERLNRLEPSIPARTRLTPAFAAWRSPSAVRTASEEVRVKRASPLTASTSPSPSAGLNTSLRIPAAPMLIVRSALSAALPSGDTVTSPAPCPAAAHREPFAQAQSGIGVETGQR